MRLQCRRQRRHGFDPWVRKIPCRKKWQPTPVFSPGESHGRRAWWATVHRVAKSQTRMSAHTHLQDWNPASASSLLSRLGFVFALITQVSVQSERPWRAGKLTTGGFDGCHLHQGNDPCFSLLKGCLPDGQVPAAYVMGRRLRREWGDPLSSCSWLAAGEHRFQLQSHCSLVSSAAFHCSSPPGMGTCLHPSVNEAEHLQLCTQASRTAAEQFVTRQCISYLHFNRFLGLADSLCFQET